MGTLLRDKHLCALGPKGLKPNKLFCSILRLSKGFCTMGALLRSKKMSPYHGHSIEGQAEVTITCIMLRAKEGLLYQGHSVDGQEMVTVACAQY